MANREKPYILFKINQYQRFELHPTKSITSEIFAPASPRCGVVWASAHHQVALLSKQPLCFSPEDPRCLFMRGLRSEPGIFLKLFYLYIGTGAWNPEFWVPSGMLCTWSMQTDDFCSNTPLLPKSWHPPFPQQHLARHPRPLSSRAPRPRACQHWCPPGSADLPGVEWDVLGHGQSMRSTFAWSILKQLAAVTASRKAQSIPRHIRRSTWQSRHS